MARRPEIGKLGHGVTRVGDVQQPRTSQVCELDDGQGLDHLPWGPIV